MQTARIISVLGGEISASIRGEVEQIPWSEAGFPMTEVNGHEETPAIWTLWGADGWPESVEIRVERLCS